MQDDNGRVYGTADPQNQDGQTSEGFRGERTADDTAGFAHAERLPDGSTVTVEEESGTAFAEVTGDAARAAFAADEVQGQVRDSGPDAMRDPADAAGWDKVDEQSDESFPASDAPARP